MSKNEFKICDSSASSLLSASFFIAPSFTLSIVGSGFACVVPTYMSESDEQFGDITPTNITDEESLCASFANKTIKLNYISIKTIEFHLGPLVNFHVSCVNYHCFQLPRLAHFVLHRFARCRLAQPQHRLRNMYKQRIQCKIPHTCNCIIFLLSKSNLPAFPFACWCPFDDCTRSPLRKMISSNSFPSILRSRR